ncbi:MAG: ABC transporter ATP-binding protein [Deltaproteobacteria bacterium]|nr:ABC transporter ATP-binding protein [Deltaproteobacteria bacterium]MBW1929821.1 ABC transporter ATP-binding protein [Deltaproteobacteria bacterium]MBW2024134.1 ABC transporter ATP-binding protein [Deltaproteobacteria bacterium]MBW2126055.1 ABC transporter ATP-binding protein [Deltaproteobacteria bacterium]
MKILEAKDIVAGYRKSQILHGVSIHLERKEVVTIIGPNGAGKSTLLKAIMGYISIFGGKVIWKGEDVTYLKPYEKVKKGFGYVPQLGNVFPSLSVLENLQMGGFTQDKNTIKERMQKAFELFPILKQKLNAKAGTLSGGQRQMLGMARALMTNPELLLLDEPSAGLSPKASEEVFLTIADMHDRLEKSIIIIEQDAYQSLSISDRGYVLVMGKNEFEDKAERILSNPKIKEAYLGG